MASRNAPKTCKQWGNYYNEDGKYGGGVKHGGKRLEVMTYQWGREKGRCFVGMTCRGTRGSGEPVR